MEVKYWWEDAAGETACITEITEKCNTKILSAWAVAEQKF